MPPLLLPLLRHLLQALPFPASSHPSVYIVKAGRRTQTHIRPDPSVHPLTHSPQWRQFGDSGDGSSPASHSLRRRPARPDPRVPATATTPRLPGGGGPQLRGSGHGAPVRGWGPPAPRTCRPDLGGRGGTCLLPGGRTAPEAGSGGEGPAGAGTRAEAATRALSPGPRCGRRRAQGGGAGAGWGGGARRWGGGRPSGSRAAPGAGTGRRGRRAAVSAPGHRTRGLSWLLPLRPGPAQPAPSRPFERWILLTYLAALASWVESWLLPDRAGLVFVTLGQPRSLPEPGECASAPRATHPPPPVLRVPGRGAAIGSAWQLGGRRALGQQSEFLESPPRLVSGLGWCSVRWLLCQLKPKDYCSGEAPPGWGDGTPPQPGLPARGRNVAKQLLLCVSLSESPGVDSGHDGWMEGERRLGGTRWPRSGELSAPPGPAVGRPLRLPNFYESVFCGPGGAEGTRLALAGGNATRL